MWNAAVISSIVWAIEAAALIRRVFEDYTMKNLVFPKIFKSKLIIFT